MAELVDAPASGAGDRKVVEVRVLFWAPLPPSGAESQKIFIYQRSGAPVYQPVAPRCVSSARMAAPASRGCEGRSMTSSAGRGAGRRRRRGHGRTGRRSCLRRRRRGHTLSRRRRNCARRRGRRGTCAQGRRRCARATRRGRRRTATIMWRMRRCTDRLHIALAIDQERGVQLPLTIAALPHISQVRR